MVKEILGFGTGPLFKAPKIKALKVQRAGDRTLKNSEKKNLKAEVGYRCQRCHKKKDPKLLVVHHKSEVFKAKRKAGMAGQIGTLTFDRKKAAHDRKSNLMVLCLECHKKIHDERSKKNKQKKPTSLLDFKAPF
ncbi:MAG: hypothetical protein ABIG95_05135 [Candidatus Woesearchaeota archaeon]